MHGGARRQGCWRSWNAEGHLVRENHYDDEGDIAEAVVFRGSSDFPLAGSRVVRVSDSQAGRAYFDGDGRETLIDGTPIEDLRSLHPSLGAFFDELEALDLSELDDRNGEAVKRSLLNALTTDDSDGERSTEVLNRAAYLLSGETWTEANDASLAVLPMVVQLVSYAGCTIRTSLLDFFNDLLADVPRDPGERTGDQDTVRQAFARHDTRWKALLREADPAIRTRCARTLALLGEWRFLVEALSHPRQRG